MSSESHFSKVGANLSTIFNLKIFEFIPKASAGRKAGIEKGGTVFFNFSEMIETKVRIFTGFDAKL
jgi:hypothetical protein